MVLKGNTTWVFEELINNTSRSWYYYHFHQVRVVLFINSSRTVVFPIRISLVSISFVKRTSSFLRFTDFLLVAYSATELNVFAKLQSGSCQDGLKLQNTAMQLLSFFLLTDSKIQHFRRWGEFVLAWEIWILNLEGRSRCISRACKCPFKTPLESIETVEKESHVTKISRTYAGTQL